MKRCILIALFMLSSTPAIADDVAGRLRDDIAKSKDAIAALESVWPEEAVIVRRLVDTEKALGVRLRWEGLPYEQDRRVRMIYDEIRRVAENEKTLKELKP